MLDLLVQNFQIGLTLFEVPDRIQFLKTIKIQTILLCEVSRLRSIMRKVSDFKQMALK